MPLGEAALLRFQVEGTGNLKWIDRPPSIEIPGAKLYPPQVKTDVDVTPQGLRGSRTWEFVVVPETGGTLVLPPVAFRYFDPQEGEVVTAETEALSLRVEGGTVAAGQPIPAPATIGDGGALPLRADLDPTPLGGARPRWAHRGPARPPGRSWATSVCGAPASYGAPSGASAAGPPRCARCGRRSGTSTGPGAPA